MCARYGSRRGGRVCCRGRKVARGRSRHHGTRKGTRTRTRTRKDRKHDDKPQRTDDAEGEAAIRQQIDSLIAALHAKDLDTLGTIYAADVVSFDVEPPLQHVGLAAKLKNWVTAFTMFAELSYELRDLALVVGDDVAFAYGFGRISGTPDNGAAANGMWVRATFCLQKLDDRWQITHDQASVPLDFASGKGVTDLEP